MSRTVIAGCGIAGATVAVSLRELLPGEEVVLIDGEGHGLYSRIRFPEVIAGKLPEEKLVLSSPEILSEKGIKLCLNRKITSLDTQKKLVLFEDGSSMEYDKFVFALGAKPSVPPVPGLDQNMTLRNFEDLHRIEKNIANVKKALVIGGGLLGLEIADSLKTKGISVAVSEIAPRLLPAILSEKESAWLKTYLSEAGLEILTGSSVEKITSLSDSYQVEMNGKVETFGLVLVSAGISPEIEIAKNAGIKVNKGICIDHRFETSAKDVYAVGDCAELEGKVFGLWMASKSQGAALASILAGKADSYEPPVFSPVPKLPGISLKLLKEKAAEV